MQARAAATRQRLIAAAGSVLVERGYAGLSTNEVANRAGVSRGTMLHHFPSRAALVAAAVEHLLQQRTEAVLAQLETVDSATSILDILHTAWPAFQDPTFATWAQLWAVAHSDAELADQLLAVDRRFTEATREAFAGLAQRFGAVDPNDAVMVRDFLFALLVGLGFQHLLPRERSSVDGYFAIAARAVESVLEGDPRDAGR